MVGEGEGGRYERGEGRNREGRRKCDRSPEDRNTVRYRMGGERTDKLEVKPDKILDDVREKRGWGLDRLVR